MFSLPRAESLINKDNNNKMFSLVIIYANYFNVDGHVHVCMEVEVLAKKRQCILACPEPHVPPFTPRSRSILTLLKYEPKGS